MSGAGSLPPGLAFDHEPDDVELAATLGREHAAPRVVVREDDETLSVAPRRGSFVVLATFVIVVAGAVTAAPLVVPRFGVDLPPRVDRSVLWLVAIGCWAFVLVGLLVAWRALGRAAAGAVPGAVVIRRTGELRLPWFGLHVPRERIVRFVRIRGRLRLGSGRYAPIEQSAVLFRDEQGRFVCAPFARRVGRGLGAPVAGRLADLYDRPLHRVDAA